MKKILGRLAIITGLAIFATLNMVADDSTGNLTKDWPKVKVTEKQPGMVPRWITSAPPKPKSGDYRIYRCEGQANTLPAAQAMAKNDLLNVLDLKNLLAQDEKLEYVDDGEDVTKEVIVKKTGNKVEALVTCQRIDSYWEKRGNTYYVVALYAAAPANKQITDRFTVTTSYGAAPVFYSLIPGVGQMYKGSTTKGGIILGSAVVVGAGIITAESLRASYIKKMKEYPKHHDFYNNKATTWKNIRNVTVGVGAGLYLYNLIDAAVAPGRPRVIVTPKRSYYYSLTPTWDGESVGLAFNLAF